jgi:hypothetical protein
VRCRDACIVQRERFKRGTALAQEHNRNGIRPEVFVSAASKTEIGRNDWAAPEPVTGWHFCLLRSLSGRSAGPSSRDSLSKAPQPSSRGSCFLETE